MARNQTVKEEANVPSKHTKSSKKEKKSKSGKVADEVLKEQILALGGNPEDYELVKDVGNVSLSEQPNAGVDDVSLSNDVSQFLSDMKSGKTWKEAEVVNVAQGSRPKDKKASKKQERGSRENVPEPVLATKKNKLHPAVTVAEKTKIPTTVALNQKSTFVVQPTAQWYATISPLAPSPPSIPTTSPTQLSSLMDKAAKLHVTDLHAFQTSSSSTSSSSEASFLSKIIQSGTLSDRLSALTLLVQSSPLHNTKALETLKGMAERGKGKGGREESLKALRCVVDWWSGGGAPNRKLKYFRDQSLLHPAVTDQHLLVWYFEDWLKKYFFSILQILETLSLDPLPYVRTQALTLMFTLLRDKPEQEQNLLRLLVNKLGDTEKSICSRVSYHILQLIQHHPAMKAVIVREIIALVLRPPAPPSTPATGKHIRFNDKAGSKPTTSGDKKPSNSHARYYATITFNQIVLTPEDRNVALKLIDVYFEIFKEILGEGLESNDIIGSDDGKDEEKEIRKDKHGRVVDKGKGKMKGKAKAKEVKGAAGFAEVEDAQSKLISAVLTGVNRALPFAKIDVGDVGINKHIDTLFLITHTSTFNTSLQALVLIQQIAASIPSSSTSKSSVAQSIVDRYYRTLYGSLHDIRLASSSKQAMYLNLLFKSIKADAGNVGGERVKALIRRFVQVLVSGGGGAPEFIAGGLFLLGELFSTIPGLRMMVSGHKEEATESYDPRKRDPQFAHASSSPLWELTPLLHHYHPAVSLHARQLLTAQPLTASADLSQNTLSHFLDRYVYKNPKKPKEAENGPVLGKGASAMQPAASGLDASVGVKLIKGEVGDSVLANQPAFLKMQPEDVPVDQLFLHKFFSRKATQAKVKAAKSGKRKDGDTSEDGSEADSEGASENDYEEFAGIGGSGDEKERSEEDSDPDEKEIWKAMRATMPKVAGDDDLLEDSDDDLPSIDDSDIDDDMDEDTKDDELNSDDEDKLSLVEGSDNEDLIPLDDNILDGLLDYDGSDSSEEDPVWGGIDDSSDKKRKSEDPKGGKRKKSKSLPTFASYEDYAKLIEDGPEDDI